MLNKKIIIIVVLFLVLPLVSASFNLTEIGNTLNINDGADINVTPYYDQDTPLHTDNFTWIIETEDYYDPLTGENETYQTGVWGINLTEPPVDPFDVFYFRANKLYEDINCVTTRYSTSCERYELDFSNILEKNENATYNYTPIYENESDPLSAVVGYWFNLFNVLDLDPAFILDIISSSNLIFTYQTEGTVHGARVNYAGNSSTAYNYTTGNFKSPVFYNTTSSTWNLTMDIADSSCDYVVSGSITPDATGCYNFKGIHNNRPYYTRADNAYYLSENTGFPNFWAIDDTLGGTPALWMETGGSGSIIASYPPFVGGTGTAVVSAGGGATINPINDDLNKTDPNLKGYWSLDTKYHNDPYADVLSVHNGTPTGTTNTTGLSSGSVGFNGVNEVITITNSTDFSPGLNNFTLSVWFRTNSSYPGGPATIFKAGTYAGFGGYYQMGIRKNSDGNKIWGVFRGDAVDHSGNNLVDLRANGPAVNDGEWHHAVLIKELDTGYLYLDGVLLETQSKVALLTDPVTTSAQNQTIGAYNAITPIDQEWNGSIDEVLYYNDVLSLDEIQKMYKTGLSQHGMTNISMESRNANNYNLSDPDLVSFWSFNEASATDEMGRNDVSIITDVPFGEDFGLVGPGFDFNGTSGQTMTAPNSDSLNITEELTLSIWINPNSATKLCANPNWCPIIDKGAFVNNVGGWGILAEAYGPDKGMVFQIDNSTAIGDETQLFIGPLDWEAGRWYHIAATFNASTDPDGMKFYIDGVLINSTQAKSDHTLGGLTRPVGFGSFNSVEGNYNLDEAKIYNRSLSASEIESLYELGEAHISDWSAWQDEGVMEDDVTKNLTGYGKFKQFRPTFNSDANNYSAYILEYEIQKDGEKPEETCFVYLDYTYTNTTHQDIGTTNIKNGILGMAENFFSLTPVVGTISAVLVLIIVLVGLVLLVSKIKPGNNNSFSG